MWYLKYRQNLVYTCNYRYNTSTNVLHDENVIESLKLCFVSFDKVNITDKYSKGLQLFTVDHCSAPVV